MDLLAEIPDHDKAAFYARSILGLWDRLPDEQEVQAFLPLLTNRYERAGQPYGAGVVPCLRWGYEVWLQSQTPARTRR